MTIAISINIDEGLILAADSFTQATIINGSKTAKAEYYNANKIYKVRNDLSAGIVSWADGRMNGLSIKSIIRGFREKSHSGEYKIDSENHTIKYIAELICKYVYNDFYVKDYNERNKPEFYCFVGGYNSSGNTPEVHRISMCGMTNTVEKVTSCISFGGYSESIFRLIYGISETVQEKVNKYLTTNNKQELIFPLNGIFDGLRKSLYTKFADSGMPLQDAIDLARFLTMTAINYHRFSFGTKMIGGHCNLALITKHKGFRWIQKNKLT